MNPDKLSTNSADVSTGKAAIVAGLGLLIMTISYMMADILVFQKLIVPGDATATANNIMAQELLFRTGICGFLIVIVCDVVVAWALYVLLKPVNRSLSLLTGWFRLVYSTIFAMALVNYFSIFQLLSGYDYLTVLDQTQLHAQVMLSLSAFNDGWAIGFVFFGLHLALLGYLVFKSDYIPRIFGVLLSLAGLSYLIDYSAKFLFPTYNVNIATFLGWGELLFMFWLLFRGLKISNTNESM